MRPVYRYFPLLLALLILHPVTAAAIPAIICHCFKDRSYDPARPAMADSYFLATSQNSFFAAVFATEKKAIVMKKQQGASADDLWIAYWLAGKGASSSPEAVLQARQRHRTWQEVVAGMGLSDRILGPRFVAALKAKVSAQSLAETVVDELLVQSRLLSEAETTTLRTSGGTNQELILAALIAARTKQPVTRLYRDVKSGVKSWGALLDTARINSAAMTQEFTELIGRNRQAS